MGDNSFPTIDDGVTTCFYCSKYKDLIEDYPENSGNFQIDDLTPRCLLHWQYTCDFCNKSRHFNGIGWCNDCKQFTCIHCGEESIIRQPFFFYNYFYTVQCLKCDQKVPALDFAEFSGSHPFQIGDKWPDQPVNVWLPISSELNKVDNFPHENWGMERLKKYAQGEFIRLENLSKINPLSVWNELSDEWAGNWPDGGDVNHKFIIIPEVIKFLNPTENDRILDIACGEGTLARIIAETTSVVHGIDFSNLIDFAISREEEEPLGIVYSKISAFHIAKTLGFGTFNKVTCNMALMDMNDLGKVLNNVNKVLENHGQFIFSITHPCFSWPVTNTIKLPRDSERNEDKTWLIDNYLDNRPTSVKTEMKSDLLYFPRTISQYVNSLYNHGFMIKSISEPIPSKELVEMFPRDFLYDLDRNPPFMIFHVEKFSEIK